MTSLLCECGHFESAHAAEIPDIVPKRHCFECCECRGYITPSARRMGLEAIADRLLKEHGETLRKLGSE